MAQRMKPARLEQLAVDMKEYLSADGERRSTLAFSLLSNYPALKIAVGPDFAAALATMNGADTDAALKSHGLHVDTESKRLLDLQMALLMGEAHRGLEARRSGDYSPVQALESAPNFEAAIPRDSSGFAGERLTFEFLLHHKAKTTSIRPKTVTDNRSYLRKFATFLGHDDARRVTKADVRRWRDRLMQTKLSPKTITDRYLSSVRAVLSHGVKEFDLPFNAASGIVDNRAPAVPTGSKGYSEEQAVQILSATFNGSSKALSVPHKRASFWVPWLLAYTGLRVTEITQLQGKRLRQEDGIPHLFITPEDGGTKSGKAWVVGIHRHLIDLGFLRMVQGVGEGPLFYEPYPEGTDLATIPGRSRASATGDRVVNWITKELGIMAPLGRPNHAWRHLFTTRSRLCGMDKEARDFMLGSRSGTDAREGYGDWPPVVLDAEINKQQCFEVEDTGWRP
ncbi:integrase [Hoeflea marina]|uniref:Integrase n=2 Tax=Hoeflea marina TaxID=274592 RepID=A0A317PJB0_9HYPH|nr:integrase [Hoeflea marina]